MADFGDYEDFDYIEEVDYPNPHYASETEDEQDVQPEAGKDQVEDAEGADLHFHVTTNYWHVVLLGVFGIFGLVFLGLSFFVLMASLNFFD